jgi:hypothetical protein
MNRQGDGDREPGGAGNEPASLALETDPALAAPFPCLLTLHGGMIESLAIGQERAMAWSSRPAARRPASSSG